ncbi:MAG: N-acetyltransferase [Phascolarctobacterium sp.]|nr:N-acetyltransferase [Phascolarctobacterium sp.]
MSYKIRTVQLSDAEAILKVYAPFITDTCISFEYVVPSVEEFAQRIASISEEYPYIVLEEDGEIVGYAYSHRYLERVAYSWDVEVTIYLAHKVQGKGLGVILYDALEKLMALQNIKNLYSCITGDNVHSIEMHRSMGYELIGTFPKAGFKHDRWLDVVWMAKAIGEKENAPLPFVPFAEVKASDVEKVLEEIKI